MRDSTSSRKKSHATLSRRQWLIQASTAASLTLAGCLVSDEGSTSPSPSDTQSESNLSSSPTPNSTESVENTTPTSKTSPPSLAVDIVAPETVETGIENTYTLSVTNTGATATTVAYGVDVRRPQLPASQTLTTAETTLEPDETQADSAQPFSNWERGLIRWTAWATADETRVTSTAGTTATLSTRSWGETYQPATGQILSVGVPTVTASYTGVRADGTSVTVAASAGTQLVVVTLDVRNATSEQRRTPDVRAFQLHATRQIEKRPHTSIGAGTTRTWTDLAPGNSEQWTLIYEVPTTVTQSDLVLTHIGAGYYADGGWQVHWR